MNKWQKIPLDNVIKLIGGGTPKTTVREYWDGCIPWLSVADFNSSKKYVATAEKTITDLGLQNSSTKLLNKDDIIISARGTVGALAMLNKQMAFNQSCYGVKAKDGVSYNQFIYYFLKYTINDIRKITHGAVFDTITKNTFKEVIISLPPLPEQKAIAEVLSSLDDKIDLLHRQNKTLESLAETLFRQWFIEEAKDEWVETKLGFYIIPKKGENLTKSQAMSGDIPVVAGGLKPSCFHNRANTDKPVITISASGANAGFIKLYYESVWSSDSSYIDSSVTKNIYFIYNFLKVNQIALFKKQTGSAQPHIYPQQIMDLDIRKYPQTLIDSFEHKVIGFFAKISNNNVKLNRLTHLRDILLPNLMSGKVRISI